MIIARLSGQIFSCPTVAAKDLSLIALIVERVLHSNGSGQH